MPPARSRARKLRVGPSRSAGRADWAAIKRLYDALEEITGSPVGAINRIPMAGEARSNMHAGGKPVQSVLTNREREICATLGPALRERGLLFVGIDVIDGNLTEINVTSPTGIRAIQRLGGPDIAAKIWDVIENKRG